MIDVPTEDCLPLLSVYLLVNCGTPLCPRGIASDVKCTPAALNAAVDELTAQGGASLAEFTCGGCGIRRLLVVGVRRPAA